MLQNKRVRYRVHNSLPVISVLRKINKIYILSPCLFKIIFNIIVPYTSIPPSLSFPGNTLLRSQWCRRLIYTDFETKGAIQQSINEVLPTRDSHEALCLVSCRSFTGDIRWEISIFEQKKKKRNERVIAALSRIISFA